MRLGQCRGIIEAVNEACTCGGGRPSCPACEVWHDIQDMEMDEPNPAPSNVEDESAFREAIDLIAQFAHRPEIKQAMHNLFSDAGRSYMAWFDAEQEKLRWKRKARKLGEQMQILRGLLTGMVFDDSRHRRSYPESQEHAAKLVKMAIRRRKPW